MYALDDIPYWATLRAIRNWYKGECESWSDQNGKYNYRWMPDGAELREIAKRYVRQVRNDLQILDDILNAVDHHRASATMVVEAEAVNVQLA